MITQNFTSEKAEGFTPIDPATCTERREIHLPDGNTVGVRVPPEDARQMDAAAQRAREHRTNVTRALASAGISAKEFEFIPHGIVVGKGKGDAATRALRKAGISASIV